MTETEAYVALALGMLALVLEHLRSRSMAGSGRADVRFAHHHSPWLGIAEAREVARLTRAPEVAEVTTNETEVTGAKLVPRAK